MGSHREPPLGRLPEREVEGPRYRPDIVVDGSLLLLVLPAADSIELVLFGDHPRASEARELILDRFSLREP